MRTFGFIFIFFFFILPAVVIGLIVYKLIKKTKADVWKGEVVDKLHKQREDFDSNQIEHFYTVIFKTDDGRTKKVGCAREVWDKWKVGDKGEKKKGKIFPEKL
jgi:hypothetical protein